MEVILQFGYFAAIYRVTEPQPQPKSIWREKRGENYKEIIKDGGWG